MPLPLGTTLRGEPWQLALGQIVMTHDDVTIGEETAIAATVAASDIPHTWLDISPLHCPICLAAHIAVMLIERGASTPDAAALFVRNAKRTDLLELYSVLPTATAADDQDTVAAAATG